MPTFQTHNIQALATALHQGDILAYPTESLWGLGCDPFNEQAVQRLLVLKKRPIEKGVILIAGSIQQVMPFISHLDIQTQKLIQDSWMDDNAQQATTWLIPLIHNHQKIDVPYWITGEHDSVALRVTPHRLVQALCHEFGGVLVSTSCNTAGEEPARILQEAQRYFQESVHYLEGETLHFTNPSQIKNAMTQEQLR